jgi:hypothetical protein
MMFTDHQENRDSPDISLEDSVPANADHTPIISHSSAMENQISREWTPFIGSS